MKTIISRTGTRDWSSNTKTVAQHLIAFIDDQDSAALAGSLSEIGTQKVVQIIARHDVLRGFVNSAFGLELERSDDVARDLSQWVQSLGGGASLTS